MQGNNDVLIIGAGPSGLTAAKYAIDNGMNPIVIEKQSEIGGVWNQQSGLTWHSMRTNLSKHSCSFIDMPWEQGADMFPKTGEMQQYLIRYANKFNLYKYIQLNSKVTSVDFEDAEAESKRYKIKYQNQKDGVQEITVDNLIIANGMFDHPFYPKMPGLNDFKGKVIHSHDYKEGDAFNKQNVLVIGGSFTGIQLSADVSKHSSKLYHSFRKPFFLMSHFMKIDKQTTLPIDLVLLIWRNIYGKSGDKDMKARMIKNKALLSLCQSQQDIDALKITEQDMKLPLFFAISTHYEEQVRNGQIIPRRGEIKTFKEHSVVFEDGTEEDIDSVILTTGYLTHLDFLSNNIKQLIEYDVKHQRQPFILFQQMFHPDIQNLVFVGVIKGSNIQACQIQSRLAISVLAKKSQLPSRQQMIKELQYQREYRQLEYQPQFPHQNYVKYAYQLAKIMNPDFDFEKLKQENPEIYKQVIMLPVIQQPNSWTFNNLEDQIKYVSNLVESAKKKIQ